MTRMPSGLSRPGMVGAFAATLLAGAVAVVEPGAWTLLLPAAMGGYVGMTLAWWMFVRGRAATVPQALLAGTVGALIAYFLMWLAVSLYQWWSQGQVAALAGMLAMGAIGFFIASPFVLLAGAMTGLWVRSHIRRRASGGP